MNHSPLPASPLHVPPPRRSPPGDTAAGLPASRIAAPELAASGLAVPGLASAGPAAVVEPPPTLPPAPYAALTAPTPPPGPGGRRRRTFVPATLGGLWLAIFFASLFAPPLLDDADATHANAARAMLLTGDWVTLHVNGIRYLEKAPLPYWLVAGSFRLFGFNTFAAHLPQAIAVLLLALLGYRWAGRAFGLRAALYTGVSILTSTGVFLFTRIVIPEVWLSLFLAAALYSFLRTLEPTLADAPDTTPPASEMWAGQTHPDLHPLTPHTVSSRPKRSEVERPASPASSSPAPRSDTPPPASEMWAGQTHPDLHPLTPHTVSSRPKRSEVERPASPASSSPAPRSDTPDLAPALRAEAPTHPNAATSATPPLSSFAAGGGPASPTQTPSPAIPSLPPKRLHPYLLWTALALAVLTKGLVALVFFFGATAAYLTLTATWRKVRRLKPIAGPALFFALAAPWHILAGLRNTGGANGHGFFWFYFINEHVLRFLGRRQPMDYNKLPGSLYWSLHLVWLFPWSLFLPLAALFAWRILRTGSLHPNAIPGQWSLPDRLRSIALRRHPECREGPPYLASNHPRSAREAFARRTTLLLTLYTALLLVFFSLSTNQEYYTFPAYLPLLLLLSAALAHAEQTFATDGTARRSITAAHIAFNVLGAAIAIALAAGLWSSRQLPFNPDIGTLLAHRNVGDYTLSMSHFFDLTGASFAALRLPACLAAVVFALGPALAWLLRQQRRHLASTAAIALTSAVFLIAAHMALVRFGPMLSSESIAAAIQHLESTGSINPDTEILLYGDQAYGSSIPFYLGRTVLLVDGRSSSMLFGSTFPDAPHLFLTPADLQRTWGAGPRKLLFVPLEKRDVVDRLLGPHQLLLKEISGKALFTDRPLVPRHQP